ncbi:aminotransferase class V-fold PLP-dependent enzyme [Leptolyngbya sp. PCC 6406]|uniref:aminotransferase class V-fold PLP-dependent enzyme n=1 Tax=Leptolyngbya sp. PCC 6406 TaxID=1173264 RepID=UPI0002AC6451|nr:aminotransferase class V-fold PLP-dependent enzyme [Leptolyngbya sp. PCC 6406]
MIDPSSLSLDQHRRQFPALAHKHYFNYGGQGPMPAAAIAALHETQLKIQTDGPFSAAVNRWLQQLGAETRTVLAHALQISPDNLTLTEDVTVGCNIPLWGLDWQAGDRILMTDCEHPGIVATVAELRRRFGVEIDTCPVLATAQGGDPLTVITDHLQPRTRLLVISHILWNTGQMLPLADLVEHCHGHRPDPVWVLVDGAQSVGMVPLDLTASEVDFYAFTGHKWCCGPAGLGGLYVRPEIRDRIAPTFIGWRSITTDGQGNPTGWNPNGQRYEVATSDYALMPALQAALAVHDQWGTAQQRRDRICHLSTQLWQGLQTLEGIHCIMATPPPSGLVSFQVMEGGQPNRDRHTQIVQNGETQGIFLRTLLHPHCVRACVSYLTLESEVEILLDHIRQQIQTVRIHRPVQ